MQISNVNYRCDRSGMDPIDFFLSLPNSLGGEAEALYRMKMGDWLRRADEDDEDPTVLFLERLRKQFPGHTAARIREFEEFRRRDEESLLTYYRRLMNLAEDVVCMDSSMIISKFLNGLDKGLAGGLRLRVYELGANASLEEVFELAERVELAQRKYEVYLPRATEMKNPTWAAAMVPETGGREEGRQERGAETHTCHQCKHLGHLMRNCRNCDTCGKPGHRRKDCPDAPTCEVCGKQGHRCKDCYQRSGGPRRTPEEIKGQIDKLQAQL
ncbi:unnamed protein product [Closterium sp. NIES-53]